MSEKPMSNAQARAVYAVLVEECGAPVISFDDFVSVFTGTSPTQEWRFCGDLGFGGKFRHPEMRVNCYPEDETPVRLAVIQQANARLAVIGKEFS